MCWKQDEVGGQVREVEEPAPQRNKANGASAVVEKINYCFDGTLAASIDDCDRIAPSATYVHLSDLSVYHPPVISAQHGLAG